MAPRKTLPIRHEPLSGEGQIFSSGRFGDWSVGQGCRLDLALQRLSLLFSSSSLQPPCASWDPALRLHLPSPTLETPDKSTPLVSARLARLPLRGAHPYLPLTTRFPPSLLARSAAKPCPTSPTHRTARSSRHGTHLRALLASRLVRFGAVISRRDRPILTFSRPALQTAPATWRGSSSLRVS